MSIIVHKRIYKSQLHTGAGRTEVGSSLGLDFRVLICQLNLKVYQAVMLMIYLHTKSHLPSSTVALVITLELQASKCLHDHHVIILYNTNTSPS